MKSVNRGFVIGSLISVFGFIVLGWFYLRFDQTYLDNNQVAKPAFTTRADDGTPVPPPKENVTANLPKWANLGQPGLDMRPAWACLIGIVLAVALNKCTEYYTGTEYSPVKSLAKSCETGHATNIIQGFAVGYESSVAAVLIIAAAILASALVFVDTTATFVAYGVAMAGIGMLTLTGNTISMDVFGPVADNANGIGEMGYNKDSNNRELKPSDPGYMPPADYKRARQILADLDAVGNTTKAITKGIAIGSAVIAAVSLFNSFIVSVGSGGGAEDTRIGEDVYNLVANQLTLSNPRLFIGMLLGGAVPFLFSSMTIRAVGRAAFLIVKECRIQFRDKAIWAGTKKPDYGRVVAICTGAAQKELVGPALLALFVPLLVGFGLGTIALAGFLGGMIVTGQLLAVFMANAGGAWDNAKKTIEDEPRDMERNTGKGSEKHKASVTGDTVGDPLKDTAGPAINPLIKVMNMVSLLIIALILPYDAEMLRKVPEVAKSVAARVPEVAKSGAAKAPDNMFWIVIAVCVIGLIWAIWQSKRDTPEMRDTV
jgi:K(+)-stimulated pyrophosphate-energized sodium pump